MSDAFVPPHVRSLDIYQPGKPIEELERELGITGALKVASNENPYGPSPRALAVIPGMVLLARHRQVDVTPAGSPVA